MATKFRREFKNVVYNYTDAEAKVREATSNDPWGPSSAVMGDLADFTHHVQAYSLVMGMLWKRLNDHGKNWRHVYKSLIVLEYLIKGGSERVAQQCKDNIFSIQTLKDFQYVDKDGKDQGANVREKAKQLVALLKDDKKLKEERQRAHQARARQAALGSDSPVLGERSGGEKKKVSFASTDAQSPPPENGKRVQPVEQARPGDENEEEMQLRLAIQLSKQQAEEEDKIRKQEEESLTAALAMSAAEHKDKDEEEEETPSEQPELLLDFDSSGLKDPWSVHPAEPLPTYDSVVGTVDPWTVGGAPVNPPMSSVATSDPFDPWGGGATGNVPPTQTTASLNDPWSVSPGQATSSLPPPSTAPPTVPPPAASLNPFDLSSLAMPLAPTTTTGTVQPGAKVETKFLGDNANLVDLDLLAAITPNPQPPPQGPSRSNPFGLPTSGGSPSTSAKNPFDGNRAPAPTLSQLASNNVGGFGDPLQPPLIPAGPTTSGNLYPPLIPTSQPTANNQVFNPFS